MKRGHLRVRTPPDRLTRRAFGSIRWASTSRWSSLWTVRDSQLSTDVCPRVFSYATSARRQSLARPSKAARHADAAPRYRVRPGCDSSSVIRSVRSHSPSSMAAKATSSGPVAPPPEGACSFSHWITREPRLGALVAGGSERAPRVVVASSRAEDIEVVEAAGRRSRRLLCPETAVATRTVAARTVPSVATRTLLSENGRRVNICPYVRYVHHGRPCGFQPCFYCLIGRSA